jgi:hypothetical protein
MVAENSQPAASWKKACRAVRKLAGGVFLFSFFVTAFAVEHKTYARGSTSFSQNPGPRRKRRVVPNMLKVSTVKLSAPIAVLIRLKACDLTFHHAVSERL